MRIVILAVLVTMASASAHAQQLPDQMLGTWYGCKPPDCIRSEEEQRYVRTDTGRGEIHIWEGGRIGFYRDIHGWMVCQFKVQQIRGKDAATAVYRIQLTDCDNDDSDDETLDVQMDQDQLVILTVPEG